MAKDSKGSPLKVGDVVLVRMTVTGLNPHSQRNLEMKTTDCGKDTGQIAFMSCESTQVTLET